MVRRPLVGEAAAPVNDARTARSPRNRALLSKVLKAASRMSGSSLSRSLRSRYGGVMQFSRRKSLVMRHLVQGGRGGEAEATPMVTASADTVCTRGRHTVHKSRTCGVAGLEVLAGASGSGFCGR